MRASRLVPSVLLTLLVLAGCGGPGTQITGDDGAGGRIEDMMIDEVRIAVPPSSRSGDEAYPAGADAPLTVTITNLGSTPERLLEVTSPGAAGADIAGDRQIRSGVTLVSGTPDSMSGQTTVSVPIRLTDLGEPLRVGMTCPVTFAFEHSGSMTLRVPVANRDMLPLRSDADVMGDELTRCVLR